MTKIMRKLMEDRNLARWAFHKVEEEAKDLVMSGTAKWADLRDQVHVFEEKYSDINLAVIRQEDKEERDRLLRKFNRQKGRTMFVVLEVKTKKPTERYSSAVEVTTRVALLTEEEELAWEMANDREDETYRYEYSVQPVKVGHEGVWDHRANYGHTE